MGDIAADVNNYEELEGYRPDPDMDRLRAKRAELMLQRSSDDWVRTLASHSKEPAVKEREVAEVESEWRRLWTHGVVGLAGGVLAFFGGILTAVGGC